MSMSVSPFTSPRRLVADMAHALNLAGIPCILWSHCLLDVYGVPTLVADIALVVEDHRLSESKATISAQDGPLSPCPDPDTCLISSSQRYTPTPAHHWHIGNRSDIEFCLYVQSEALWRVPPLGQMIQPRQPPQLSDNEILILSSDRTYLPVWRPGRGDGAFLPEHDLQPVVIPRAHILLEAYLCLLVRDNGKRVGSFSMAMVDYILEYVDDDGYLEVDKLAEPYRALYQTLKKNDMPFRQWQESLLHLARHKSDKTGTAEGAVSLCIAPGTECN